MEIKTKVALQNEPKFLDYLHKNSEWYKLLNRDKLNYPIFIKTMKNKYHLNMTDKISTALDNIDLISSIIDTLK